MLVSGSVRVLELNMVDHPFKPRENLDVTIAGKRGELDLEKAFDV